MSIQLAPDRTTAELNLAYLRELRIVGALAQLVAIGLFLEILISGDANISLPLKLSLVAIIMVGIVRRQGWLALIAIQISLLVTEPRQGQIDQIPVGIFFVFVALIAIVVATNVLQTHSYVTDFFLRLFGVAIHGNSAPTSISADSKKRIQGAIASALMCLVHLAILVLFATFLVTNLPIGRQGDRWLQWSLQNGQVVWPGALLVVSLIALLVWARELAWRHLEPSQARLYLRSIQLIATYRDLVLVERYRQRRLHKNPILHRSSSDGIEASPVATNGKFRATTKTNSKGIK